eukprot:5257309-Lingulodinium_polyedra.AAC.1
MEAATTPANISGRRACNGHVVRNGQTSLVVACGAALSTASGTASGPGRSPRLHLACVKDAASSGRVMAVA